MPPLQAFAYPLLLAAIYGVYRVGRTAAAPAPTARFGWARLAALVASLAFVSFLHLRLAESGLLTTPWGIFAAVLSTASVVGLVGLETMGLVEARRRAGGPARAG